MLIASLPQRERLTLREMTLADLETVHRAEMTLFPADAWPLEMFLAEIQHETRAYVVVEKEGEILGYAGAMSIADTADIQTIAVLPEHEGKGYGSTMLDFLHEEVTARGAERILLEVRADNPRAQALYSRKGYRQIHRRRNYYNDGTDAIIMEKSLNSPAPTTDAERLSHDS